MSQEEEWLYQYTALLRDHVIILREHSLGYIEQLSNLKKEHQQEKAKSLYLSAEPIRWAQLLTKHNGELTELINSRTDVRTRLLSQQKQEAEDFKDYLESEKRQLNTPTQKDD